MIVEVSDIADNKKAFGHVAGLPDGVGLGKFFEKHDIKNTPDLSPLLDYVLQVKINGRAIPHWQTYHPNDSDRITIVIGPRPIAIPPLLITTLQVISAIATIASFIMSLFAQPQTPSQTQGKRESDTYAFEGIRDTYQLGSPLPVTYGQHRKGCQVLMYYLTMMPGNKGTKMHMLGSFGEGPVDAVEALELNDLSITEIESVTSVIRLGTSSQAIIPGFETIKNTFHDGREITDKQKNGLTVANCSHVIYRTSAYDVEAVELFVVAPNGCYKQGSDGRFKNNWSRYVVQYRRAAVGSMSDADAPWTTWETRQLGGRQPIATWDFSQLTFPKPDQYDIKLTWRAARVQRPVGRCMYTIHLADVTEIRGPSTSFSQEVVVAINAAPTAALHGGQPNMTAAVKGLKPRVYSSVNSYVEQWTDNPAWPMVDWMTNSRYGMGADISHDEVDIQSFLDFATLAESLAETCITGSQDGCPRYGTANFYDGDAIYIDSKSPLGAFDDSVWFTLRSKYRGVQQSGIVYCQPCCPPDFGWGVNSSDFLNSWNEIDAWLRTETSGSPNFGLVSYVRSGTNQFSGTFYGWIINAASSTATLSRWNGANPATLSTILQTYSWAPHSGDEFFISVDQNYDLTTSYGGSNLTINIYASNGTNEIDVDYVDSSVLRIPHTVLDRAFGLISMPTNVSGDDHIVNFFIVNGQSGLCYSPIGHLGSHELTCIQAIPYYST